VRISRGKPSLFARPWRESRPIVLLALIALNASVFVAQVFLDAFEPGFVRDYLAISDSGVHQAYAWQFFTAAFLYASPWHFIGNVLVLYILGRDIESILGERHFFYLFLSGVIGGELGHLVLMPQQAPLYAASGGVAAVLIAYASILPELDLISWEIWRLRIRLKAKHVASTILVLSVIMLLVDREGPVMHSAIPGGLAAGWLYADLLGFGRASWLRRFLMRRREKIQRLQRMSREDFIEQQLDPILEKISRSGMKSLNRAERRILAHAREKVS